MIPVRYKLIAAAVALALLVVSFYGYGMYQYRAGKLDEQVKWTVKIAEVRATMQRDLVEAQKTINDEAVKHSAYVVQSGAELTALKTLIGSEPPNVETDKSCKPFVPRRVSNQLNRTGR